MWLAIQSKITKTPSTEKVMTFNWIDVGVENLGKCRQDLNMITRNKHLRPFRQPRQFDY
jgi:hypothetical protein